MQRSKSARVRRRAVLRFAAGETRYRRGMRKWPLVIGAILVAGGGIAALVVHNENELTEERNQLRARALDRLRRGPFDEVTNVDEIVRTFNHEGTYNANHLYSGKLLRVDARYYDTDRDKNGDLLVVTNGDDSIVGVACLYIGDESMLRRFHRGQRVRMHAIGAVEVDNVIAIGSCVLEPP